MGKTHNVILSDSENRNYFSTVSNIESILGVHELTGHILLNLDKSEHWKILKMQREHPSWKKMTQPLKDLYKYLEENKPEYQKQ